MDAIYELQADVMKTLANPRRLEIVHRLAEGPCEVTRLAEQLGISQPNLSQHLAVMRAAGVVEGERSGREIHYRLTDAQIVVACGLMRAVLERRLQRLANLYHIDALRSDATAPTAGPRRMNARGRDRAPHTGPPTRGAAARRPSPLRAIAPRPMTGK